jgi:hypothetical protein
MKKGTGGEDWNVEIRKAGTEVGSRILNLELWKAGTEEMKSERPRERRAGRPNA